MTANELADEIQKRMNGLNTNDDVRIFDYATAELRRLHEVNQELLDALKSLVNSYQRLKPMGYPLSDSEKQAQAAIAKAEGDEK